MSLEALTTEALAAIAAAEDLATLDQVRVQFTGKKSQLAEQSKALGKMDPEQRKDFGAQIHAVREAINAALTARQAELQQAALAQKLANETVDITLPGRRSSSRQYSPSYPSTRTYLPILYQSRFYRGNGSRS